MNKKQTASSFLDAMKRSDSATSIDASALTASTKPGNKTRAGLKHIGGYLDAETVEKVAILRARLRLDNSQLIKKAITELFSREDAARKFGDR